MLLLPATLFRLSPAIKQCEKKYPNGATMKYPGRESIPISLSSLAAGVTAGYGEMIMDFVLGNGFCIPLLQLVASIESKGFHQTQCVAQFAGSNVCLS